MWPLIRILPVKTNFRFVAFARLAAALSILAAIGSMAVTLLPFQPPCGGLNCGIDFRGGTVLQFSTAPRHVDLAAVRRSVSGLGLGDVQVQGFGAPTEALVQFQNPPGTNPNQVMMQVQSRLRGALGEVTFQRNDVVGPKVSGELLTSGVLALVIAIGMMLVYIWFRFELQFGLGAVVALFHDVILTFGFIALLRLEFSLTTVAALLTIIGYSMNDTVVVFDRLRENLRKYKRMPMGEIIDLSINETLSRTIITGLTAVLALAGLAFFGGEALFSFSVIMIFGIALGTYSSIYVAAPVILLWGRRKEGDADDLEPIDMAPARRNLSRP